ncbi:MAG: hypothetical protein KDK62_03150 [Chlamydiia bacterium]|nr:hypothetical protein [Chlamydiia bacterium]
MLSFKKAFLLPLLLLSACGWHAGEGDLIHTNETVVIPFAEGDWQGTLTRKLVDKVATETALTVVNCDADLELAVIIRRRDEENVGFRYDRNNRGERIDYIIPSETRVTLFAEVTLLERATGCARMGPLLFEASYDFDHDYYSSQNAVNIFSLGQLTDYDEAIDAALVPLYEKLAEKITDYLQNAW